MKIGKLVDKDLKKFLKEKGVWKQVKKYILIHYSNKELEVKNTFSGLSGMFLWDNTEEGVKYWSDLWKEFKNGKR